MLIINADDLGYSHHRDAGIFAAYENGYISSASLLVNGTTSKEAAKQARELGMSVGLHLNLSEGYPLADVPSIQDSDGNMHYKMKFWNLEKTPDVLEDIVTETKAQLEQYKEWMGTYPTRIDGHQHVHIARYVPEVLAPLFQQIGVRHIRIPDQDPDELTWLDNTTLQRYNARYVPAVTARLVYYHHGMKSPLHFIGLGLAGSNMTINRIQCLLEKCTSTTEFMVHPGFCPSTETEGQTPFDTDPGRFREYHVLKALKDIYKLADWS